MIEAANAYARQKEYLKKEAEKKPKAEVKEPKVEKVKKKEKGCVVL